MTTTESDGQHQLFNPEAKVLRGVRTDADGWKKIDELTAERRAEPINPNVIRRSPSHVYPYLGAIMAQGIRTDAEGFARAVGLFIVVDKGEAVPEVNNREIFTVCDISELDDEYQRTITGQPRSMVIAKPSPMVSGVTQMLPLGIAAADSERLSMLIDAAGLELPGTIEQ